MAWTRALPRSEHCSQLTHVGGITGTGLDDCGISAAQRRLREGGELDPAGDIVTQLGQLAYEVRDHADNYSNGTLSVAQVAQLLANHGVGSHYTESFGEAHGAAWSLLLVDGTRLAPAQYPAGWFGNLGGQANHFILWLPAYLGSDTWVNDPLAYWNGQEDCQYSLESLEAAFYAALILPSTGHGEDQADVPQPPRQAPKPVRRMVSHPCGLLPKPLHGTPAIATLPAHGQLLDSGVRRGDLAYVQYRAQWGWVQANLIVPVA
jgi:hypothetical protein